MRTLTAALTALTLALTPANAADVSAFTAESAAAIATELGGTNVQTKENLTVFDFKAQDTFSRANSAERTTPRNVPA